MQGNQMARAKKRGGRPRKPRISMPPIPLGGDHGSGTQAARQGVVIEKLEDNANHMGRARRVEVIDTLTLTLRQKQAATAIRNAYCRVQMLSSGGELKEQVDASPKPDATIAAQVDAQSAYVHVMRGVRHIDRPVVEHVCFHNRPLNTFDEHRRVYGRFKQALDFVADHMRY